ncbi:MAG: hypothetical protein VX152_12360, partial [Pseudomonadota bacterium]|nr:hypothetical protein [Pseudomonadota bacterium]
MLTPRPFFHCSLRLMYATPRERVPPREVAAGGAARGEERHAAERRARDEAGDDLRLDRDRER